MEEKIEELYKEIVDISAGYLIYQKRENVTLIKKIIPQIQEFVLWFLEGNRFGIEEELYLGMCQQLMDILQDILNAIRQEDVVLLHDAAANGLLEYLKLFAEPVQEAEEDEYL